VNDPADPNDDVRYGKDALPFGVARVEFAGADGIAEFALQPGDYRIAVSRGTEYSLREHDVQVSAGSITEIETQIARVLDTTGFVSHDFHVHMLASPDSWISLAERVLSYAGEGTDNIVATDHDAHTPLADTIASLGLSAFVHGTVGEEITTSDFGHFNGYPLDFDPERPTGGSTDWAGAAPAGEDFPSLGNYVLEPREIHEEVVRANSSPNVAVQVNHIDSHFDPLQIDTALVPPATDLDAAERSAFRLDPAGGELFHLFDGLELWNGADSGAQRSFLDNRIGVWMNHLNQGLAITAIADSDSHTLLNLESAGARTWTPASDDAPALIDDDDVGAAVRSGRAVGGQGVYVQARLVAESTGEGSGFALGDPLLDVPVPGGLRRVPGVTTSDGRVHLDLEVQAPTWAPYDRLHGGGDRSLPGGPDPRRAPAPDAPARQLRRPDAGHLDRGGGEGVRRRVADVPGVSPGPRFLPERRSRDRRSRRDEAARPDVGGGRRARPRLHQRPVGGRGRRRRHRVEPVKDGTWFAAVVAALGLAVSAAAEPGLLMPGAVAPGLLEAAAAAEIVVVGRAGETERIDRHGRATWLAVERVVYGEPPQPLRVAWEDLAPRNVSRLPEGERVLVALDPLPGLSLWRQRFPAGGVRVISARGSALRVAPAAETEAALAGFLALSAQQRESAAAVPALVALAGAPDSGMAREALARLDALPGLARALEGPTGEQLAATALRGDTPPERGEAILALAGRRRLRALLPSARAASAAPGALEAAGWQAWGEIEGGLAPSQVAALLARDDGRLRAVGAAWLRGEGRLSKLRSLLEADPDGGVRASALRALGDDATEAELVQALADPDAGVVHLALASITARGQPCVAPLLGLVEQGPAPVRPRALAALAQIPEGRAPLARIAREHPDPQVRGFAALALGRLERDPH
jgi:hypothetical protein